MAPKKSRKSESAERAPRGDASGLARIRLWTNALETEMIERYVGNATTLKPMGLIVKQTMRDLRKIKPIIMSDCPEGMVHQSDCHCADPFV